MHASESVVAIMLKEPTLKKSYTPSCPDILRDVNRFLGRFFLNGPVASPSSKAIEATTLALKVSTEAYLTTTISTADVAIPYSFSALHRQALKAAHNTIGLEYAFHKQMNAGYGACLPYKISECVIGEHCNEYAAKPQLVLIVDYSRAALTLMMYIEETGVFEHFHTEHDTDLGADSWMDGEQNSQGYWDRVIEQLRKIVQISLSKLTQWDGHKDVPRSIEQVILLGERATDEGFSNAVRGSLGDAPELGRYVQDTIWSRKRN